MKIIKGPEGFDHYYSEIYGARWPDLKQALLGQKKHIAIVNPYSDFQFKEVSQNLVGLTFNHHTSEYFPPPATGLDGHTNYYLLDAASVLAIEALDLKPGEKVADLCAAPGGKSLLAAFKLKSEGLLISNDRSATRRARIHKIFDEYIPKAEHKNHKVTGFDATKWCLYEKNIYDKVLLDAPCSSERHVLLDQKELATWAPGRSKALAYAQFAMLASALDIVKEGGLIVYSTCSLSPLENDEIIRKLHLKRRSRFEVIKKHFSFGEETEFGWQVLPDKGGWGPFYLSIIKKLKDSPDI